MKKIARILGLLFILPITAVAQSGDDIETERPSESFGPAIVTKNHLQVEAGFRKERSDEEGVRTDKYLYPTAGLRYGLTKKLELRMLIEQESDYQFVPEKQKSAAGLEPIKVGLKYNLFDEKGALPKTSLIARADVPKVASRDFKADFVAPLFRLAMENSITKKLSLEYNIGEEWEEDDVHGEFFYGLSPHYDLSDKLQFFAELFGLLSNQQEAKNSIDAGLLYKIAPNFQLDISGGVAISKNAPANFVDLGISFRVPR